MLQCIPCHICAGRRCDSCAGLGYEITDSYWAEADAPRFGADEDVRDDVAEAIKRAALPPWEES